MILILENNLHWAECFFSISINLELQESCIHMFRDYRMKQLFIMRSNLFLFPHIMLMCVMVRLIPAAKMFSVCVLRRFKWSHCWDGNVLYLAQKKLMCYCWRKDSVLHIRKNVYSALSTSVKTWARWPFFDRFSIINNKKRNRYTTWLLIIFIFRRAFFFVFRLAKILICSYF